MTPSQPPRTSSSRRATVSNGSSAPSQAAASSSTAPHPSAGAAPSQNASSLSAGPGTGSNTELRAQLRRERERAKERGGSEYTGGIDTEPSSHSSSAPRRRVSHHHLRGEAASSEQAASDRATSGTIPPPLPRTSTSSTAPTTSSKSERSGKLSTANSQNSLAGTAATSEENRPPSRAISTVPGADEAHRSHDHLARVSGPPDSLEHSFGVEALQAAFSAKYYELANKCKNWERYGAKLRAQAEALEVENRLLRELSAKQDTQIGALEVEKAELSREVAWQVDERRACEARLGSLQEILASYGRSASRLARHANTADSTAQYHSAQAHPSAHLSPTAAYHLDISAPSAPSSSSRSDRRIEVQPYCSSDLQLDDECGDPHDDLRPPTPVKSMTLLGDAFEHALQSRLHDVHDHQQRCASRASSAVAARIGPRADSRLQSQWTNGRSDSVADILRADEDHRNHAALHGEGHGQSYVEHAGNRNEIRQQDSGDSLRSGLVTSHNASGSVPPHSAAFPSLATVGSSLRPTTSDSSISDEAGQRARIVSSHTHLAPGARAPSGTQRLRVSPHPQQRSSSQQPVQAGAPKSRCTNMSDPSGALPSSASVPNLALSATESTGLGIGHPPLRNGSALSDAATVTGDFLQDIVEQRRQNRRTSLSQQQQAQFRAQLQKQQEQHGHAGQAVTTSSLGKLPSALPVRPPSRPSSRMSNLSAGGRGGTRSRAGSVHDSIPILSDDIFSEQPRVHSLASAAPESRPPSRTPLLSIETTAVNNSANGRDTSSSSASSAGRWAPSSAGVPLSSKTSISSMPEGYDPSRHGQAPIAFGPKQTSPENIPQGPSVLQQQQRHLPSDTYDSSTSHGEMVSMSNDSFPLNSTTNAEMDLRGAHRALYARLRSELGAEELTKFEKYVHRYDGLEIPLDGPRGLVNRVKKLLLLADPTVREDPARLKVRKQLAREFERIVRVDLE